MAYLVVNNTKSYYVTDNYNKPYIKVNGSILPLTSNGGGWVIRCKDNNGNTYRPLEYKSQSASNTYYTTMVNSDGLSSTTALTRASTSDTSYETRASTSDTSYATRASTSGTSYLTQIVSSNWYIKRYQPSNGYTNIYISYFGSNFSASFIQASALSNKQAALLYGYAYMLYRAGNFTITRVERSATTYSPWAASTYVTSYTMNGGNPLYNAAYDIIVNTRFTGYKNVQATSGMVSSVNYTMYQTLSYEAVASTTGTSYLTRSSTSATNYLTRSSTSATIYLTRSSTSGYSGVSSSSSESSGWE